jgi:hypothetical protein
MAQPVWITPAGSLGTIPEGVFYEVPLQAYEPESAQTVFYSLVAGTLPPGVQFDPNGFIAGIPSIQGVPDPVTRDITTKFAIRAYTRRTVNGVTIIDRLADRTFTLTITGQDTPEWVTPPGKIAQYFDGEQIAGLQLEYTDNNTNSVVRIISGSLPPGLTISSAGLISGLTLPTNSITVQDGFSRDGQGYDQYPYDFFTNDPISTYSFTLGVSNNQAEDVRTFNIVIYSRSGLTADTTFITADNTFVTADGSPIFPPIITTPQGSIGTVRGDNFFAFQFQAIDLLSQPYRFELNYGDSSAVAGLVLDPITGYLYGYLPDIGITQQTYDFTVRVYNLFDPLVISDPYEYSLTVVGPISSTVTWLVDPDLGTIDNGSTSTFYVAAVNVGGLPLSYRLLSGSDSKLPQGLELLENGLIAGRVSFNTFALDGGTTTFDVIPQNGESNPTTFDLVYTFTVNAYSSNGVVDTNRVFTITVTRAYNEPYENLYIQAMPPQADRDLLESLLQNTDIFPVDRIYRQSDPNFGVAQQVVYNHAYGLTSATLDNYVASLDLNHYWKNLVLGSIQTAQALDDNGNVLYEVVYSKVVDNLVNDAGESVAKQVVLPFPIDYDDLTNVTSVYPNSLVNMRDQVIDTVGQISNILPRWMLSQQSDGRVLGFTPAWVIAYCNPGQSGQIAYNIKTQFGEILNKVDFEVDRYELDRALTYQWDPATQQWIPTPPSLTTFDVGVGPTSLTGWTNDDDEAVTWVDSLLQPISWINDSGAYPFGTTFDGNSLQFIAPVIMYNTSDSQIYDKYLVFPKRNILK